MSAFDATKLAATTGPAMLWNVPLRFTSIFGTRYVPRNFQSARNGVSVWQYASGVEPTDSGTFDAMSQLSVTVFPVLTPPCRTTPARGRALKLTSIPFQRSIWLPYFSADVMKFCAGMPNF